MASKVEIKWNQSALNRIRENITKAMVDLGMDTAYEAQKNAPYDTGALVESIRISVQRGKLFVVAGGTASGYNIPYARRREYENNLHPDTKKYMHNALDWAGKHFEEYFKDITK